MFKRVFALRTASIFAPIATTLVTAVFAQAGNVIDHCATTQYCAKSRRLVR